MDNPKQQIKPVSAPLASDKDLRDFSGTVQENLSGLWDVAHDHLVSDSDQASYAALTTDAQRIQFIASFLGLQ